VEEQLFVRIRGHVQGPYELDKLRALVRRGQLSRMHEVSSDGSVWKQAASFPELFQSPTINGVQAETRTHGGLSDGDIPEIDIAASPATGRWHYAQNDVQKGPVAFDELRSLVASGNLDRSELVWTDGMKEWAPAQTIAGLVPTNIYDAGSNLNTASGAKVDKDVSRTLSESLPWSKFIASVMYFVGSLGVLLGVAAIVMGARWNMARVISTGGFSVLYGIVFIWGGYLLFRYCGDIGRLLRDHTMGRLDASLRSLRRFWIFLSIILIVLLVNAIGVAIWLISIGVSLSGPN
jgi:hypothetical protein